MHTRNSTLERAVVTFLSCLLTVTFLAAQPTDRIPLKNWAAPLYWQPPVTEESKAKAVELEPHAAAAITPPLVFVGVTPCRLMDTRAGSGQIGPFGPPSIVGNTSRTIPIPTHLTCGIPGAAQAYSLNVTVVPSGSLGYLTIWPTGQPRPVVSTLNAYDGQVTANAAVVPAGVGAGVDVYVTNNTDVIIDINGYYLPPSALALGAGAAVAPSLTFSNDANSGLYSPGAGAVSVAASGVTRLTVSAAGISVAGDVDMSGDLTKSGQHLLRASSSATGVGLGALNNLGSYNTAFGANALHSLSTGSDNTAVGEHALFSIATNGHNTAVGKMALQGLVNGEWNVAVGDQALMNSTGSYNTGVGYNVGGNFYGSNNTLLGWNAGSNLTTGDYNIAIANNAVAGDDHTTRIGSSQTRAFIAGVRGVVPIGYQYVVIDASGQLGSISSSRRFKQDIHDLGNTTEMLMELRPVRFRYKAHGPNGPEQYGLVAEEVAEVAPELVGRGKDGEIDSVAYDKVNAMLLNEVQKQHKLIRQLESRLAEIERGAK